MRIRSISVILVSLFSVLMMPCVAVAQVTNGIEWRLMSPEQKAMYMIGFRDAIAACSAFVGPVFNDRSSETNRECRVVIAFPTNRAVALLTKVSPGQLSDALDQFYEDATNRLIKTPRALSVIFMRFL